MLAIATTVLLVLAVITVPFVHRIESFGTHYAIFILSPTRLVVQICEFFLA